MMAYDTASTPTPPTHLHGQARSFLRAIGYEPSGWSGSRTARAHLHDTCWHCDGCGDWYARKSDMADEADCWGWDRSIPCHWCRWNLLKPGEVAQRVAA